VISSKWSNDFPEFFQKLEFLKAKLEDFKNQHQNQTVAIACSGGVDSMFLAHFVQTYIPNLNFLCIIIDHSLQKNSCHTAHQTKETLGFCGIDSVILTWKHEEIQTGIEEKARNARYKLITDFCKSNQINHVLVAHHVDDKIETFFMNSMRGTGLQGLISMREYFVRHKINFFRPMLSLLEKSQIVKYMTTNNLKWIEDETNKNINFTRNNIRQMLCINSVQKNGILNTIQTLENALNDFDIAFKNKLDANWNVVGHTIQVNLKFLQALTTTEFRMCIIKIMDHFEIMHEVRQKSIYFFQEWLENPRGKYQISHIAFQRSEQNIVAFKINR